MNDYHSLKGYLSQDFMVSYLMEQKTMNAFQEHVCDWRMQKMFFIQYFRQNLTF